MYGFRPMMVMSYCWLSAFRRGKTCSQCDSIPPMTPGMPRNPTTQTRVLAMPEPGPSDFGCTGTRPACTLTVPLPTPHLETAYCLPGSRLKAVTTWKQHAFVVQRLQRAAATVLLQRNRFISAVPIRATAQLLDTEKSQIANG